MRGGHHGGRAIGGAMRAFEQFSDEKGAGDLKMGREDFHFPFFQKRSSWFDRVAPFPTINYCLYRAKPRPGAKHVVATSRRQLTNPHNNY